ncbi:hypothetical protein V8E53_013960 [Lactarius tabidus]
MPLRRFVLIDIVSLLLSAATITIGERQRLEWARAQVVAAFAFSVVCAWSVHMSILVGPAA